MTPSAALPSAPASFAAIDFGTSNSAVALPDAAGGVDLVALEDGLPTMPTAVFYRADTPAHRAVPDALFGRARSPPTWRVTRAG